MRAWRKLSSAYLVQDRWLTLRADRCELPNGKEIAPYYVIEDDDWVQIFAQGSEGRVLLVRQYRHAAGAVCAELPGGVIDQGESPLEAAKRELREETGYTAEHWTHVGALYANPARQTNRVHVFLAEGLTQIGPQELDDAEEIDVSFADVETIKHQIRENVFAQSLHVASFFLCLDAIGRRTKA